MKRSGSRSRSGALSISKAAERLRIARPIFYGVLLAYHVKPVQIDGHGTRGRPPRVITAAQFAEIKRRLKLST